MGDGTRSREDLTNLDSVRQALSGRYQLEREIGRGGMATVYLAQDLKHPRQVALKVLRPEVGGALGSDRFLKEIELVSGSSTPISSPCSTPVPPATCCTS